MAQKKLPIAEIFHSPQGEGQYAGTMMTFIRIAGCSVGKKMTEEERAQFSKIEGVFTLPMYREKCTLWDGRTMACDTNYQTKEALTVEEIMAQVPEGVEHICITGGEPLNHDLSELIMHARGKWLECHIETSGTVPIQKAYPEFIAKDLLNESMDGWIWLTVSPKFGCLDSMLDIASEVKLLVDADFDATKVPASLKHKNLVYIQPVNLEHSINLDNTKKCLELQKKFPHWRISQQAHKEWGVR